MNDTDPSLPVWFWPLVGIGAAVPLVLVLTLLFLPSPQDSRAARTEQECGVVPGAPAHRNVLGAEPPTSGDPADGDIAEPEPRSVRKPLPTDGVHSSGAGSESSCRDLIGALARFAPPLEDEPCAQPTELGGELQPGVRGVQSESESRGIEPIGYFVARSLQGGIGTRGGKITPKDGRIFLVIVSHLPAEWLHPSEPEFKTMQAERSPDEPRLAVRQQVTHYDPREFLVVLADGRGFQAELISTWEGSESSGGGYCPGAMTSIWSPAEKSGASKALKRQFPVRRQVAVAWIFESHKAQPPFRLAYGKNEPVTVPTKTLKPPPIRDSFF